VVGVKKEKLDPKPEQPKGRRIMLAGTHRDALVACERYGWPPPGHLRNGERTLIFTASNPERLRGLQLAPDDEVRYGHFGHSISGQEFLRFHEAWEMVNYYRENLT
jgi:hypothetical protein